LNPAAIKPFKMKSWQKEAEQVGQIFSHR